MIAILVPVLGRAHQIQPLIESVHAGTESEHRIVFVCSPKDPATKVCQGSGETTIVTNWSPGPGDFAKKINLAYRKTDEPWLFQGATDLHFHEGWDTRALTVATRENVGVVGTNDLGNPLVVRGLHATHILFSREYIETYGGTFDGTGAVFSETYDHQYVDTEFIQIAKSRGQFRPCLRSIVEHLHPHWDKGEMDDTYEKAMRATRPDAALHVGRMRRYKVVAAREEAAEKRKERAVNKSYRQQQRRRRM